MSVNESWTSDKDDLIFFAICTPRFSVDAYEDIEKTERQDE